MKFAAILFAFVAALAAVHAADYCQKSLCPAGNKHIACGHSGKFHSKCPANARLINIKPHINTILNSHNEKRNLIASGSLKGYEPAVRMAKMRWNKELAKLAALNVKQCAMKHDKCRNTASYSSSGQNLAIVSFTGTESKHSDSQSIKNLTNGWWNEYRVAKMAYINSFPAKHGGPSIGHFTVMTAEKNVRVGCAAARYYDFKNNVKWHHVLLACNYATTNFVGEKLYTSGPTASACTTGTDATYSSLCSAAEKYTGL